VTALRTIQADEGDASDLSDFDARRGRSSAQFSAEGAGRFQSSRLPTRHDARKACRRFGEAQGLHWFWSSDTCRRNATRYLTKLTAVDDTSTSIRRYNRV
jgi:hypothetical protein